MKTINKLDVWSAGKAMAVISVIFACLDLITFLIFGTAVLSFIHIQGFDAGGMLAEKSSSIGGGDVVAALLSFVLTIIYGFIVGVILAWVYNHISKHMGRFALKGE